MTVISIFVDGKMDQEYTEIYKYQMKNVRGTENLAAPLLIYSLKCVDKIELVKMSVLCNLTSTLTQNCGQDGTGKDIGVM